MKYDLKSYQPGMRDQGFVHYMFNSSESDELLKNFFNTNNEKNFLSNCFEIEKSDLFNVQESTSDDFFNYLLDESITIKDLDNLKYDGSRSVSLFKKYDYYKNKVKFKDTKVFLEICEYKSKLENRPYYLDFKETLVKNFNNMEKYYKLILQNFQMLLDTKINGSYKTKDFVLQEVIYEIWIDINYKYCPLLFFVTKPSKLESQKYLMVGVRSDMSLYII